MMHRKFVHAIASVLMLMGCGDTTSPGAHIVEQVRITVSPAELRVGDVGVLTIRNDASTAISVGLCETLEHYAGIGRWEEVSDPGKPNCADNLREIGAGETFSSSIRPIPEGALPGSYRLRLDGIVTRDGSGRLETVADLRSEEFTVR